MGAGDLLLKRDLDWREGIQYTVIAKYAGHAGHVRQTPADVRQRVLKLPDILSSRVQYTEISDKMSDIKYNICRSSTQKNVLQQIKMSGRALKTCRTFCPADLK